MMSLPLTICLSFFFSFSLVAALLFIFLRFLCNYWWFIILFLITGNLHVAFAQKIFFFNFSKTFSAWCLSSRQWFKCLWAILEGVQNRQVVYCPQTTCCLEAGSTIAQSAAAHSVSQHAATSSSSSRLNRGSSKTTLMLIRELCTPPVCCPSSWMAHIHSRLFTPPPCPISLSPILLCPQSPPHPPPPTPSPSDYLSSPVQHAWVAAWRWRS